MYECVICKSLNHASRLHCQNCGTIPAMYSWNGKPSTEHNSGWITREIVKAKGAETTTAAHARIWFRTVPADYYAEV